MFDQQPDLMKVVPANRQNNLAKLIIVVEERNTGLQIFMKPY
jgi:hypothetical protein